MRRLLVLCILVGCGQSDKGLDNVEPQGRLAVAATAGAVGVTVVSKDWASDPVWSARGDHDCDTQEAVFTAKGTAADGKPTYPNTGSTISAATCPKSREPLALHTCPGRRTITQDAGSRAPSDLAARGR